MKTVKAKIVIGVNKGYGHNNKLDFNEKNIGYYWQVIANKVFIESNVYVSAVIQKSTTVYNTKWGCPSGGEDTFNIECTANPEFIKNIEEWKKYGCRVCWKDENYFITKYSNYRV
jgi:hypothetical protein